MSDLAGRILAARQVRKARRYALLTRQSTHLKLTLANALCRCLPLPSLFRARLYRLAGFDVGNGVFIMDNLNVLSGVPGFYDKLHVGNSVVIGQHVTLNLDAEVTIGHNVSIGPFVIIYTGTHAIGPGSRRRLDKVLARPVCIEDGVWVGLGAIILPGVTVGQGSIVGAGSVVTSDVPPNTYVEGNPAAPVRELPWGDR